MNKFMQSKFLGKINKIIQYLTISDLLLLSAWGLISPFMAIFIMDEIPGSSIESVGLATTLGLAVRAILQIPIARIIDQKKGELDDYHFLFFGSVISAIAILLYLFATSMWHIYAIEVINAIGGALTYPSWAGIFTRHLDKNSEASGWTFYDTVVSVGTSVTAALGGVMIATFGYRTVFAVVAALCSIGSLFILAIRKDLYKS